MKRLVLAIALCSAAFTAWAQHQPYAGHQDRAIKALSAEEIEQYLSGSGMGFAKPAELNGYPGPMHVIEPEMHPRPCGITESSVFISDIVF